MWRPRYGFYRGNMITEPEQRGKRGIGLLLTRGASPSEGKAGIDDGFIHTVTATGVGAARPRERAVATGNVPYIKLVVISTYNSSSALHTKNK